MTRIRLFLFYTCMAVLCIFKPSEGMRMAEDADVGAALRVRYRPPARRRVGVSTILIWMGSFLVCMLWLWVLAVVGTEALT